MTTGKRLAIIVLSGCVVCPSVRAADDIFDFYKEEAKVLSASRLPHARNQTPATVYVVSQEDIKASGAQNIWDALRNVPGVHVMETRTGQGDVGIRGENEAVNRHTLILLDGQSVFNPYFDYLTWASLPVGLNEIDRIEVIEGPASAIYGADAFSGVINIITKTPEQVKGPEITYTAGERSTQITNLNFGQKKENLGMRFGGGWNSTNRFEDASRLAAQAGHFDGTVGYDFSKQSSLNLAGGYNHYNAEISNGLAPMIDQGQKSFLRADYHFQNTLFKTNWDRNRGAPDEYVPFQGARVDYDTYETGLEQTFALPLRNHAVIGGSYKHLHATSSLLQDSRVSQDFWSAFFEDKWELTDQWLLMTSGRVDRHPLTPLLFSPRGSLLFTPVPEQVFRVSAGTAYRNPTLIENYFNSVATVPNPDPATSSIIPFLQIQTIGNRNLDPEIIRSVEVAHTGQFGRLNTSIALYHWESSQIIRLQDPSIIGPVSPTTLGLQQSFTNTSENRGYTQGGELGLDYTATEWLKLFTNYTLKDAHSYQAKPITSARHQANLGFRTQTGGFTTQGVVHWVDKVTNTPVGIPGAPDQHLPAYFLVDAHVGYAFHGELTGLEAGVNAFNLLNHAHFEYNPIQGGEIVKGRLTGTVSYKF